MQEHHQSFEIVYDMGTLARTGIIDGRKVLLQATMPGERTLSPFDASLLGSTTLIRIAEKLICREHLSAAEISEILSLRSIPTLLKLRAIIGSTFEEIESVHTLFLPIDTWLDRMDPNAVVSRAVAHIRRQRIRPDRVVVEIRDFSDLEHLWPDILDELRVHLPEHSALVAPDAARLMDWIGLHDRTGSRAVRRFQFEQKLNRLLDAGFDALEPTRHPALLRQLDVVGFPAEAVTRFSQKQPVEELGRELLRVTQTVGELDPLTLHSWTPEYDTASNAAPRVELDLLMLHAHLVGSIVFPEIVQIARGDATSPEVLQFLQTVGVPLRLYITSDGRTARRTGALLVETDQPAVVLSGSFCSNDG